MKKALEMKNLVWTKLGDGTYAVAWEWRKVGNKKWIGEYDFVDTKELGLFVGRLKKAHTLIIE